MLHLPRLTLFPLSADQLALYLQPGHALETSLGLPPGRRKVDELLRNIIHHFTLPRLQNETFEPLFHTLWTGLDRTERCLVGEIMFKGAPDDRQTVELGYGTHPAFQGRGYMKEMVGGMVNWAAQQPNVARVIAETAVHNKPSQRVLLANDFRPYQQQGKMLWWERWVNPDA